MIKRQRKKKEFPYILEKTGYAGPETIKDNAMIWVIKYGGKEQEKETKFELNTRTSSCGSLQIMNLFVDKYHQMKDSGLNKEQRQEIFDGIKDEYDDFNHIFFIDCEEGGLERFFGDLGFTKCWQYCNINTENIVNVWCYNRLGTEEVRDREDEDDDWDDDSF